MIERRESLLHRVIIWTLAIVILVVGLVGFGMKFIELIVVAAGEPDGASLLSMVVRGRVFRLAAWCVVITGCVTLARGVGFLTAAGGDTSGCPWCP